MNKAILCLMILLILSSCRMTKVNSQEKCLMLNSSNDKIYILSCFPENIGNQSNFISSILLSHSTSSKQQISAFVNAFDCFNKSTFSSFFFNDSIENFNSNSFPLLVQSAKNDSLLSRFIFSLDRKKTTFTSNDINFKLSYSSKQKFVIDSIGGSFLINRIIPLKAKINELNGTIKNQTSNFIIHTIDKPEEIYNSQKLFWIDIMLRNEVHSLFLKVVNGKNLEIIYSSLENDSAISFEQVTTDEAAAVLSPRNLLRMNQKNEESIYFELMDFETSVGSISSYQVKPIQMKQNNAIVGSGIIYILNGENE